MTAREPDCELQRFTEQQQGDPCCLENNRYIDYKIKSLPSPVENRGVANQVACGPLIYFRPSPGRRDL